MKNKITLIPILISLSIIILATLFINVFSHKKHTIIKHETFYNVSINTLIKEDIAVGYRFVIDSVDYVPGDFRYVIGTSTNDERLKILDDGSFSSKKRRIIFSWRETEPPFQLIKKEKADTLYIIKNGMKFSFPKVYHPAN